MKSLVDSLPPEIARQIHPDWQKNEAGYWAVRDSLLQQYRDQWVAFADDEVIASGRIPVDVFHAGQATGLHPYFTCVGHEHEPDRVRRAAFPYDSTYPGEALPVVSLEFRTDPANPGAILDCVIPDTGSDVSVLPWADCQRLQLNLSEGALRSMGGVGATSVATVSFSVWVVLDSNLYRCQLNADFSGRERILGRDVLNRIDVLFRGTTGEVIVNP
jgi:hypothetical protein